MMVLLDPFPAPTCPPISLSFFAAGQWYPVLKFRKWCPLGGGAIAVEHAGVAATQLVGDFSIGAPARYPILIISYELYRCALQS